MKNGTSNCHNCSVSSSNKQSNDNSDLVASITEKVIKELGL
jgi:hypothetical protein